MPCESPFFSDTRLVSFSTSQKRYHVHTDLINAFEETNSKYIKRKSNFIILEAVPEGAGRVFIDYLYSGSCRLSSADEQGQQNTHSSDTLLEVGLEVYCFAQQHRVEGLAQLVRDQVAQMAISCPPLRLLEAAKRACSSFPEEDSWLNELVRRHSRYLLRRRDNLDEKDAIHRLLSPSDNAVSHNLLGEMLSYCASHADTPTQSALSDDDTFAGSHVTAETAAPEPSATEKELVQERPPAEEEHVREPPPAEEELVREPWPVEDATLAQDACHSEATDNWWALESKKYKKKGRKGKKQAIGVCVSRSEHFGVDMAWLRCDACKYEVGQWANLLADL